MSEVGCDFTVLHILFRTLTSSDPWLSRHAYSCMHVLAVAGETFESFRFCNASAFRFFGFGVTGERSSSFGNGPLNGVVLSTCSALNTGNPSMSYNLVAVEDAATDAWETMEVFELADAFEATEDCLEVCADLIHHAV